MPAFNFKIPDLQAMNLEQKVDILLNALAMLGGDLNYTLNNLDKANINEIRFVYDGGKEIKLNRNGLTFFNGANMTVQLDLITGNAILTGAKFQTSASSYPRIEINSEENLLKIMASPTETLTINPFVDNAPAIQFDTGNKHLIIGLNQFGGSVVTNDSLGVHLFEGARMYFQSWDKLSAGIGVQRTLQEELNDIWAAIAAASAPPPSS